MKKYVLIILGLITFIGCTSVTPTHKWISSDSQNDIEVMKTICKGKAYQSIPYPSPNKCNMHGLEQGLCTGSNIQLTKNYDIAINNIYKSCMYQNGLRLVPYDSNIKSVPKIKKQIIPTQKNIGFLLNQKYVCINIGVIIKDKLEIIMSKEQALNHPIRIKVDDNNILHTDGKKRFNLPNIKEMMYGDNKNRIMLSVNNNKRHMTLISKEMKNIPMVYTCTETNNWSLQ